MGRLLTCLSSNKSATSLLNMMGPGSYSCPDSVKASKETARPAVELSHSEYTDGLAVYF